MQTDSCGPTNAIQKLNSHAQRDNSLQNEASRNQSHTVGKSFRSHKIIDQNLNQDFKSFLEGSVVNSGFSDIQNFSLQNQRIAGRGSSHNNNWVENFSQMNLRDKQGVQGVNNQNTRQSDGSWQGQFMRQNMEFNGQQMNSTHKPRYSNQAPVAFSRMNNTLSMANHVESGPMTEHQELHVAEQENRIFDDHFEELEKEMRQDTEDLEAEQKELEYQQSRNPAGDMFAATAQKVQDSLLNAPGVETSEKFKNSNFLKLMASISNKAVELSTDGTKLIDARTGSEVKNHDIEQLEATPEASTGAMNTVDDFSSSMKKSTEEKSIDERQTLIGHLPDPLAHLKEGDLSGVNSPLQAARIISGNQVQTSDWMEDDVFMSNSEPIRNSNTSRNKKHSIVSEYWRESFEDYMHDDDLT